MPRKLTVRSAMRERRAREDEQLKYNVAEERKERKKRNLAILGLDDDDGDVAGYQRWAQANDPMALLGVARNTRPGFSRQSIFSQIVATRRSVHMERQPYRVEIERHGRPQGRDPNYTLRVSFVRYVPVFTGYATIGDEIEHRVQTGVEAEYEDAVTIGVGLTLDAVKSAALQYGWAGSFPDDL